MNEDERAGIRGRLPEITWSIKDTIWGLIAGLILALLAPIVILPFDPDLSSDGALLAAQGVFGICLLGVPLGVASNWNTSNLRVAWERLGLRRFARSALGWMLLALFVYYLFAGLFSTLVLEPQQDDIAEDLGVGDESVLVAVAAVVLIVGAGRAERGDVLPRLRLLGAALADDGLARGRDLGTRVRPGPRSHWDHHCDPAGGVRRRARLAL